MSKKVINDTDKEMRWEAFVAGWGAGLINVGITFPLHKLIFRQMLYGVHTTKALEQLQKEGFRLLYRGLLPPLCQKTMTTSIMFGSYRSYGQFLIHKYPDVNPQICKSVGAGLAGLSEAILTPFERIQTLLQHKDYNSRFKNSYQTVTHIWRKHGLVEFYRGLSMVVLRNSAANIIFFAAKEKAESVVPKSNNIGTKYLTDFISGGVIGAAISTVYYPLNVIKTRMQSRLGGSFESPRTALNIILDERGGKIRAMFRGVHLNYTRALISWGIITASYELLIKLLYKVEGKNS